MTRGPYPVIRAGYVILDTGVRGGWGGSGDGESKHSWGGGPIVGCCWRCNQLALEIIKTVCD